MTKKSSSKKKSKKSARKSPKKKAKSHSKAHLNQAEVSLERKLIENFISLQKVMTHMSIKFDNLSGQISKLLELFEISAKSLAEKDINFEKENKDSKKIIEKIDNLIDQNKIIAKGLTLLHETRERPLNNESAKKVFPQEPAENIQNAESNEYQQSISTGIQKFNPLPKR